MTETVKTRAPRWMRWGLVVSLALNVFVVCAVVAGAMRHGRPMGPDLGGAPPRAIISAAPEGKRAAIKALFDADAEANRAQRAAIRAAQKAVDQALRARPYDPEALSAAQRRAMDAAAALGASAHARVGAAAAMLSDDERAALTDAISRRARWGRHAEGHGDRGGHGGRD